MKKRVFSLLLSIAMLTGLFLPAYSVSAVAEETEKTNECIASGGTSSSSWILATDGTLTFSGSYIGHYADQTKDPWYPYREQIKRIVISGTIDSIPANTFCNYPQLTAVEVTHIYSFGVGNYAFENCTSLKHMDLGSNVTKIGTGAFSGCSSLEAVFLPPFSYPATIESYAFSGCEQLREISFPGDITLGEYLFTGCPKLTTVYFSDNSSLYSFQPKNTSFYGVTATVMYPLNTCSAKYLMKNYGGTLTWTEAVEGVCGAAVKWYYDTEKQFLTITGSGSLWNYTSGNETPWGAFHDEILEIQVTNSISHIPSYSFEYCKNAERILLPQTLVSICLNAFNDCESLNNILLPSSLNSIGNDYSSTYSFIRCPSLTDVYYLGTEEEWLRITNADQVKNTAFELTKHFLTAHSKAPTCTQDGIATYYTFDCDQVYSGFYDRNKKQIPAPITTPALGHSYGDWNTEILPGCETEGKAFRICHVCQAQEYTDVSSTGHSYESTVTPPTCLEDGCTVYHCTVCGSSYTDSQIAAIGHSFAQYQSDGNATCTQDGTKTAKCDRCDITDTITDLGSTLGHRFTDYVPNADSTCTQDGTKTAKCERCDETDTLTNPGSAQGHHYTSTVTQPTCLSEGYTIHICTVCGGSYIGGYTSAVGHSFTQYQSDSNATCTKDGTKTAKCDRCEVTDTITDVGSATGHMYDVVISVMPNCTELGIRTYTCTVCGESHNEGIQPTGHTYQGTTTKEPGCMEYGICTWVCAECQDSYTENIPMKGHIYYKTVIYADCVNDGGEFWKCGGCGDSYTRNPVEALGHSFTQYTYNGNATCTADGTKTAKCDRCDETDTKVAVGTAGHIFTTYIPNGNATCNADGTKTATCDRCDVKDTLVDTGSKGHKDHNTDYWCDVCSAPIPHDCVDEDLNFNCDLCNRYLEHDCVDVDGNYWCDYDNCLEWIPHECIDEDLNYSCDLCQLFLTHDCMDDNGDSWCDICGAWFVPCVDADGDYWCDNCGDRIEHDCVDEEGDYYCDICWNTIAHDCEDKNSDYWCDLCGSGLPHDCLDEDSDYRCDICYGGIPHDCIDENNDYLCDLCASLLEHECVDTNGDYLCDICDWWIPHDCVDQDGNYRCDICDDRLPHDCIDENVNYLCDYCNSVLDHPCFDENADYRCDVCFAFIDHDCIDEDNNYYCDRCACVMEHDCVDNDGDYNCDYCYWPIAHRCVDKNADYLCDLAGCWLHHDHVDHNGNFFCDICHYVMDHECVDEDRDCWCDIFGCQLESGWGPHATTDIDGDNRCDLCCRMLEHDCYDMDNDELCDLCHQECSSEEEYLLGDITGDGNVNMGDVAKLYAHIKGTSILTDENDIDRCDITGDGNVNMGDVAKLYAHIKGTSKLY